MCQTKTAMKKETAVMEHMGLPASGRGCEGPRGWIWMEVSDSHVQEIS